MPFMDEDPWGARAAGFAKYAYGPMVRYFRKRNIKTKYDKEPEWRHNKPELTTGYSKRW
jgi:hydrogenase small subunit